ncbi:MAG: riboflavin synthase [Nitrospirae bacterium]|nr:riboflavin synthase [Nitrospirota bacterium]
MFTGIIVEMGEVKYLKKFAGKSVLSLKAKEVTLSAKVGDSISINGVCLTVINLHNQELSFDLSEETLNSTNLGSLSAGDLVNIEPSLTPDSKIGGHFVTGHVDTVGTIRSKVKIGDMLKIEIEVPQHMMNFIVEKGSVAVDGISLTVVDVFKNSFTLIIIPHTAKLTTLGFKAPGDTVNIEADILGKYVAKFLNRQVDRELIFMNTLKEGGFI